MTCYEGIFFWALLRLVLSFSFFFSLALVFLFFFWRCALVGAPLLSQGMDILILAQPFAVFDASAISVALRVNFPLIYKISKRPTAA